MLWILAIGCRPDAARVDGLEAEVADLRGAIDVCPTRHPAVAAPEPGDDTICPTIGDDDPCAIPLSEDTVLVDLDGLNALHAPTLSEHLGPDGDVDGLVVGDVTLPDSLLARVGLRRGDVILAVDGVSALDVDTDGLRSPPVAGEDLVVDRGGRRFRRRVEVSPRRLADSCGTAVPDQLPTCPGVRAITPHTYVVQSALAGRWRATDAVADMARFVPHQADFPSDEGVDGYRLSGIRRGSPLSCLGVFNGDIVTAVDGQPIRSVEGAMDAWQAIQHDDRATIALRRRGADVTLTWIVR